MGWELCIPYGGEAWKYSCSLGAEGSDGNLCFGDADLTPEEAQTQLMSLSGLLSEGLIHCLSVSSNTGNLLTNFDHSCRRSRCQRY